MPALLLPRFGVQPPPWGVHDARSVFWLLCAMALGACCAPAALVGRIIFGSCPLVPRLRVLLLMIRSWWQRRPLRVCFRLSVFWLTRYLMMPFWCLCYYLDELINLLNIVCGLGGWGQVQRPIFEISNRRSGSTDMGIKLAAMPGVYAPSYTQLMYPFYWLWRLEAALRVLGIKSVTAATESQVVSWRNSVTGREMKKMQNTMPSKPGTFEAGWSMWTAVLGPVGLFAENIGAGYGEDPDYLEQDIEQFVRFTSKLLHKCASFAPGQRLMIKGHMLYAANKLACHYPGSTFVCLLRDPLQQIASSANWLYVTRSQSLERKLCGEAEWPDVIAQIRAFSRYWDAEVAFYTAQSGTVNKLVLSFQEYVEDSAGAISKVLRAAGLDLDENEITERLETMQLGAAGKGERDEYRFRVSLEQLGIAHLPSEWCAKWYDAFQHKFNG